MQPRYNDHEMTAKAEEKVKEESEDEFKEEIKEEEEEEEEEDVEYFDTFPSLEELSYHEWLLKYPKPSWVNAKIRTGSLNNVKFSCMIGHFVKKEAYIDLESPVNVMSRLHYNWIMSGRLELRMKPSNPMKTYNFVGRVRSLKVFVGHFTYECDFIILEDTTSIIDHDLGAVLFGKPFVEKTRLIYDKKEEWVSTDMIPPFIIEGNEDDNEKTHYSNSLNLGPEYKYDESFKWTEKTIQVAEGSSKTTTEGYIENYKNVSQDIRDQLNAEAEAVQIILTGIDNDIYSTIDACPNAYEMWKAIERFVTLVKKSQELKTVSYHKLYDILKQHQNEVNEIRDEILARAANPLALVAQQQPTYHPQNHPNHHTQNSSTKSQQATRNRGRSIVNSFAPIYDQEPATVTEEDEMSKEKKIDKLMALISLSFKKIYKPTNNNLQTSSNTSRANQDNYLRINRGSGYENQRVVNVVGARENVEQADWKDDTDDESDDRELEAHYMYMAQIQEVTPNVADISRPIFDTEPLKHDDQDDTDKLAQERDLLASLIEKLKCEIDDNKNRNKFLESSNKALVDKLKDLKKFQAELNRYHDVNYASNVAIDFAKAKGDLIFAKPEFLKKAQRANPCLYDIGCYNDNIALMLAPESDETIRLAKESRSKLSDLIRPFDYDQLNNLYDLFVPQREKSPE
ncbi:hypothetical protein Tco_0906787 [Tanacetum coccineum]|uniref:Uncharacterized protein n=1 Tax=Tanacetum coccineum TaxID=301880 RepID=A0ABQ5CIW2_9ASTR